MALTKIGTWTNPISSEADRPSRTATDMKAIFDSNTNQIKTAFNANVDALTLAESVIRRDTDYPDRYLSLDGTYSTPSVGQAANGVVEGGTAGQVYVKQSASDFDGDWVTIRPSVYTVSLPSATWASGTSCTLTVSGKSITASSIIFIAPSESVYDTWTINGVRCTGCGTDTLSFVCDQTPTTDLSFELVVWNY